MDFLTHLPSAEPADMDDFAPHPDFSPLEDEHPFFQHTSDLIKSPPVPSRSPRRSTPPSSSICIARSMSINSAPGDIVQLNLGRKFPQGQSPKIHHFQSNSLLNLAYTSDEEMASPKSRLREFRDDGDDDDDDDLSSGAFFSEGEPLDDSSDYGDDDEGPPLSLPELLAEECEHIAEPPAEAQVVQFVRPGRAKVVLLNRSEASIGLRTPDPIEPLETSQPIHHIPPPTKPIRIIDELAEGDLDQEPDSSPISGKASSAASSKVSLVSFFAGSGGESSTSSPPSSFGGHKSSTSSEGNRRSSLSFLHFKSFSPPPQAQTAPMTSARQPEKRDPRPVSKAAAPPEKSKPASHPLKSWTRSLRRRPVLAKLREPPAKPESQTSIQYDKPSYLASQGPRRLIPRAADERLPPPILPPYPRLSQRFSRSEYDDLPEIDTDPATATKHYESDSAGSENFSAVAVDISSLAGGFDGAIIQDGKVVSGRTRAPRDPDLAALA